jgi:hypothetical protein
MNSCYVILEGSFDWLSGFVYHDQSTVAVFLHKSAFSPKIEKHDNQLTKFYRVA